MTEPTAQDVANAARRQEIATRQAEEYGRVLAWAMGKFGRGWTPSGRYYLVDKDDEDQARKTGERPKAAATCFIVKNCVGRKRYFTVDDAGIVTEHPGYKEAFGDMLLDSHPTQRIEVKGQMVAPHRYSLCWAAIELYNPKSVEELQSLRVSRERGKVEREKKAFAADFPLLDQAGIRPEEVVRKGDRKK